MTEQLEMAIDVATRTTRGRTCPRCGGKIIPSDRSVYQSPADPNGVFAAWQCERCSYEEVFSRPSAPVATRATPAKTVVKENAQAPQTASGVQAVPVAQPALRAQAVVKSAPPMQDTQGRDLPADVCLMISQMNKAQAKLPTK